MPGTGRASASQAPVVGRVHGRGDGPDLPRRAGDPGDPGALRARRRASRWPPSSRRSRSARWSPATCGWTATSPSRARCSPPACCGAASSPPPRRSCSRASAASCWRLHREADPRVARAPVTEEACKGLFLFLLLWWRRAELDGVLDGIVYAGMVGIGFAFTENILYLAAAYNGTDGMGPGGTEALTADVRRALPVQPVRAPAVHDVHRHRRRARRQRAQRARPGCCGRSAGYVAAVAAHAVWNIVDGVRLRQLRRCLRRAHGAGPRRGSSAWRSGRAAPSAGCWPPRSPTRPAAGWCRRPTSGGSWTSAARRRSRAYARAGRRPRRRARDARLPAGCDRARVPPLPFPARHAAARLRGPRPAVPPEDRRSPTVDRLPRTGGTHQMTVSSDHDTRMLTALVQLHDALQAARLPLDVAGAAELRSVLAADDRASSRTTSSRAR